MNDITPVFIAGSSRSGTTMLARMLDRHPEVASLRELHFFEELWSPAEGLAPLDLAARTALAGTLLHRARTGYNLPEPSRPFADEAQEIAAPDGTAVDVFLRFLGHEAEPQGAAYVVEQTPRNAYVLDSILSLFPEALVLSLVRDPRDVALSQRNWWKRGRLGSDNLTWRTTFRRFVDYHPVTVALVWRSAARACDACVDPRHRRLRFEDLVDEPEGALRTICDHIGIEPSPEMLAVSATSSSNVADEGRGVGVDSSVVGRGSELLPRAERWVVERMTRKDMHRHGYRPTADGPGAGLALVAVTLAPKMALALLTNLRRAKHPVRAIVTRLR